MSCDKENLTTILSGSASGIAQTIVGHPLDTLKVLSVTQKRNSFDILKSLNFKNMYNGILSPLSSAVLLNTSIFYSYEFALKRLPDNSLNSVFLAGAFSGIPLAFLETPTELLKCQLQANPNQSYRQILSRYGVKSLYRGYWSTLSRNIPQMGLYFWSYEMMKRQYPNNEMFGSFLGGGLAGLLGWGTIYPIDSIKTRMQTDSLNVNKVKYSSYYECMRNMSFKSYYRGFYPCIIRAVPVNACVFLAYSYFQNMFRK